MPGNNSLSHVAKCLAIDKALRARGHDVLIAVSRKSAQFLTAIGREHAVLPDIQENDGGGMPTIEWFRRGDAIGACVDAEVKLLQEYRPERALGVFRFTLKASARIAGVPYDSLVCGCMLPDSDEVLGFAEGEPGRDAQRLALRNFFRYAAEKVERALSAYNIDGIGGDVRSLLKGERTFLWDFPEFSPLPDRPDLLYVGPISWNQWPYDAVDTGALTAGGRRLAIVSFGTCVAQAGVAERIARVLARMGYNVLLAAGGQREFLTIGRDDPHITVCSFAPLPELFPSASLLVSHGGQMTVFEALCEKVPVLVMPFQPEQAHNGVCLERIGCGRRLLPAQQFHGDPSVYLNAFNRLSDDGIASAIRGLTENPRIAERLAAVRERLLDFRSVERLTSLLEAA